MDIGLSIGHFSGTTGTAAGIVKNERGDFILSCAHVFSPKGRASIGDIIVMPSMEDSDFAQGNNVGQLMYFNELSSEGNFRNEVDFALASTQLELDLPEIDFTRISLPFVGDEVFFNGRTTTGSQGEILDTGINWYMELDGRYLGFRNQIQTSCRSSFGDSGALLFSITGEPIAMVIGQSNRGAIATSLFDIYFALFGMKGI